MENNIINNEVADENKRMDYAAAEIISNRGTVKVHGNEFNFENMSINGQETGASVVHARIHKDNNFDDNKIDIIKKAGVDYVQLEDGRVLCVFSANQAFLMIMDLS